jgi:hypothetical protein
MKVAVIVVAVVLLVTVGARSVVRRLRRFVIHVWPH